jgi:UDP-N-acetylmuramyl pentapeptide phosphotransferase/UDP-N-acetylglucosamine-1-phosphate transferase
MTVTDNNRTATAALPELPGWITNPPPLLLAAVGFALLLLATILIVAIRWLRRTTRPGEDILTIVAACIATGVSAQGMWRFSGDVLGFDGPLRLLLFAFIEVAVITSAVRARRNMRENYSAGIDGIAVWALTSLSAVLSSMDARSVAEALFRLAAPLVAAWLWERGMAIERRRITGKSRINWRITPERILVRLGLAEAGERTASEVDAQRRLTAVALAAKRCRDLRDAGASERQLRRAMARLQRLYTKAAKTTGLARDPEKQTALKKEMAGLLAVEQLANVEPSAVWMRSADRAREAAAQQAVTTLREWSRGWPAVATSDQDATTLLDPPHFAGAPQNFAAYEVPRWPTPRRGADSLPPLVTPGAPTSTGAPVAPTAPAGDRSRPAGRPARRHDHEQGIDIILSFWREKGHLPTKRECASKLGAELGYGETWWHERLQEAKRRLKDQGRHLPDDSTQAATATLVANGSRPARA